MKEMNRSLHRSQPSPLLRRDVNLDDPSNLIANISPKRSSRLSPKLSAVFSLAFRRGRRRAWRRGGWRS